MNIKILKKVSKLWDEEVKQRFYFLAGKNIFMKYEPCDMQVRNQYLVRKILKTTHTNVQYCQVFAIVLRSYFFISELTHCWGNIFITLEVIKSWEINKIIKSTIVECTINFIYRNQTPPAEKKDN